MKQNVRPLRPKPKRLTSANRQRIRDMVAKGINPAAIAAHFEVPVFVIEAVASDKEER